MRGLDKRLTDKINIPFHIAEDPLHSVAKGTGIALKNLINISFLMYPVLGLVDFLKKYSFWLHFILLEGGSLLLLFRFNLYQGSVWFTSANTVSGRVLEWESDFLSYIALGERNKDLMRKNLVLEQRVRALTELLDRAEHDSTYTEMRQRELLDGFGMVPAEVVSNSVNRHNNYLTIN